MTEHLWTRLLDAKSRLAPVQSKYRVAFEDPIDLDAPLKVLGPDLNWMAAALAGGIVPPVEAYWGAKFRMVLEMADGEKVQVIVSGFNVSDLLAELTKRGGKMLSQVVVDYPPAYAEPLGPMTEEQAIEYLIKKDMPPRVWKQEHNRAMMAIVHRDQIPTDRTYRNAWDLSGVTP